MQRRAGCPAHATFYVDSVNDVEVCMCFNQLAMAIRADNLRELPAVQLFIAVNKNLKPSCQHHVQNISLHMTCKELDMSAIDVMYIGVGPARAECFDVFDDSGRSDGKFDNCRYAAEYVYNGPYPMVDHIMMPIYEQTSDICATTSFQAGDEISDGNLEVDHPGSEHNRKEPS